jgi:NAD(P)-dependent dehydrogenase (short-subunit alcohol dehydrogenase family)
MRNALPRAETGGTHGVQQEMRMKGKIVVVTGAAGALGAVLAARLAAHGARVIGLDMAKFKSDAGFDLAIGGVDLGAPDAIKNAFATIQSRFESLDGLANIAGGFAWETVADGSVDTWDRMFRTNVRSCLLTSQASIPLLRKRGGAIVNVSAFASQRAEKGNGAYAASKAAVSRLTESLAAELKDDGVRVNAVMPSIIDTPANRAGMPNADFSRWVAPEALADAITFLLSDDARAITGALMPVLGRV